MTKRILTLVVSVLVLGAPLAAQSTPNPGAVTGSVVDDSGKPVIHARIFINQALPANVARPAAPPVITGPHVITAMTDYQGNFISGHLAAGSYVACAQYAAQGLLDPCHWSTAAPNFTIAAGQTTAGVKITMTKGAIVTVHVDDPQHLLAPSPGAVQSDLRFQFVTAKGDRYDAVITAHNQTSRDHTVTLPFGAPVTLQVVVPDYSAESGSLYPGANRQGPGKRPGGDRHDCFEILRPPPAVSAKRHSGTGVGNRDQPSVQSPLHRKGRSKCVVAH